MVVAAPQNLEAPQIYKSKKDLANILVSAKSFYNYKKEGYWGAI